MATREEPMPSRRAAAVLPDHHRPEGGFRNPWLPPARVPGGRALWRWRLERLRSGIAPDPDPDELPVRSSDVARDRAGPRELRVTWVGHATFLLQIGRINLLTDPVWSRRASPVSWAGPARLVAPGLAFDALPPIDAVLLSHDHYDHLDDPTVRRLARRFLGLAWITPLGFRRWLERRGATRITELDWWQEASIATPGGELRVTATPAQHWCRRSPIADARRLWASFAVSVPGGPKLFFCGDSGYFPGFREIGARLGPFDAALLPIGAYEPRWFMQAMHMDPEEAVRAYLDLGGVGAFVAMHWGTFRLSDEPPLEPPARARAAWQAAGLDGRDLWILAHGETRAREVTAPPAA